MAAQPITCKAMVAFGVNDLRETKVIVAPPKAGEVTRRARPATLTCRAAVLRHEAAAMASRALVAAGAREGCVQCALPH